MGHPYAPQSMFLYQRRKGTPAPTPYEGIGNYATSYSSSYKTRKTYSHGSLSPRVPYAKPGYVRGEADEVLAGFGEFNAQDCILAQFANPDKLAQLIVQASPIPGIASNEAWQALSQVIQKLYTTAFDALKGYLQTGNREQFARTIANELPESIEKIPGVSRTMIGGFAYDTLMGLANSCGSQDPTAATGPAPQLMQIGLVSSLSTGQGYTGQAAAPGNALAVSRPTVGVGTGAATSLKLDLKTTSVQTTSNVVLLAFAKCVKAGGTPTAAPQGVIDPKHPKLLSGYSIGQLKSYLAAYAKDFKKWGLLDLPDSSVVDVHCVSSSAGIAIAAGVAVVALLAAKFMR